MPAAFTPTWSRPPARWPRCAERRQQRTWPARRRLDAGGGVLPQRQRRAGVAVRPPQAAASGRRAQLRPRDSALHLARCADGCCFHSLMTGRFGAPANQALSDWMDEAAADNPLRGCRLASATTARRWIPRNATRVGSGHRGFLRVAHPAEISHRRAADAASMPCVVAAPADVLADPHLQAPRLLAHHGGQGPPRPFRAACSEAIKLPWHPATLRDRPERVHAGRWPACGCSISPGRWSARSPRRCSATWAASDQGRDPHAARACRASTCRSRASRAGNFDDKPWFAHLNTSKRSVALDLKQAASRECWSR